VWVVGECGGVVGVCVGVVGGCVWGLVECVCGGWWRVCVGVGGGCVWGLGFDWVVESGGWTGGAELQTGVEGCAHCQGLVSSTTPHP